MTNPLTFRDFSPYVQEHNGVRGVDLADGAITKSALATTASTSMNWKAVATGTAGATAGVTNRALVSYIETTGLVTDASAGSTSVAGINIANVHYAGAEELYIGISAQIAKADSLLESGYKIKSATGGRVTRLVDSNLASSVIITVTSFGTFPATAQTTATVSIVSASTADTTTVTVYYASASGTVVNVDILTLSGTTTITSAATAPGTILGIELGTVCSGAVTVTRTGSSAFTIITAGSTQKGVITVTATRCFNAVPFIANTAASTAVVSVLGTGVDYATAAGTAATLPGTTAGVTLTNKMNLITKVLTGDSAVGVKVLLGAAETAAGTCIGRILTSAAATNDEVDIVLFPIGLYV